MVSRPYRFLNSRKPQLTLYVTSTTGDTRKRNPEIWSPISRLLSLRLSALGSTVKLGIKGDCRPLQLIVTKLRRDEKGIILNEDEVEWLESNDIAADPYDWSEWKNCYHTTSITSTEFLRTRTLLSNENKKEYRKIHGGWMLKIQNEADAGRIGKAIQAIVGRSPSFLMESLRQGDSTITDGHKIHTLITAFFATWFSRLPAEKERDRLLAECVISQDRAKWDSLMTLIGIPSLYHSASGMHTSPRISRLELLLCPVI